MIANPWGLLALLAVPAILAIHLFRHRFEPRRAAGLFLWASPGRDPTSGRRVHRLDATLSLLLEILLALALSAFLLDLRPGGTEGRLSHAVVVLDGSAALSAKGPGFDTAARAREAVKAVLDRSGRQAQASLVASGERPVLLAGPAAPAVEALKALVRWTPSGRSRSLASALDLARELAGPDGEVHVVSDRLPAEGALPAGRIHWHAVGRSAPNAAILGARRERTADPSRDRLFLRLGAFGGESPVEVEATLSSGQVVWARERRKIESGSEWRLALDVEAGDQPVEVSLAEDALAADNAATLLRPPERPVRCALHLPEGPLRAAVEKALAAIPDARIVSDAPHLAFAPADRLPSGLPGTWWLRFGAPPEARAGEAGAYVGPFVCDRADPLLRGVSLGGVVWAAAGEPLPAGQGGLEPLVLAGDTVLLGRYPAGEGADLLANLDLARSNLQQTSDWPVWIANLVRARQDALSGLSRANVAVGETVSATLPQGAAGPLLLALPDGTEREVGAGGGRTVLDLLERPGTYRLLSDGAEIGRFAVHFADAAASDLSAAETADRPPPAAAAAREERRAESLIDPRVHFPLLLAALALLFLDAWAWKRRRG